jgi:hypothetical protein
VNISELRCTSMCQNALTDSLLLCIAQHTLEVSLGFGDIDSHCLSRLKEAFHLIKNTLLFQFSRPIFFVNILGTPDRPIQMTDIHFLPVELLHLLFRHERRIFPLTDPGPAVSLPPGRGGNLNAPGGGGAPGADGANGGRWNVPLAGGGDTALPAGPTTASEATTRPPSLSVSDLALSMSARLAEPLASSSGCLGIKDGKGGAPGGGGGMGAAGMFDAPFPKAKGGNGGGGGGGGAGGGPRLVLA